MQTSVALPDMQTRAYPATLPGLISAITLRSLPFTPTVDLRLNCKQGGSRVEYGILHLHFEGCTGTLQNVVKHTSAVCES